MTERYKNRRSNRSQAGISLVEAILGIAIMGGGLGLVAQLQKDNIDRINQQITATQMETIRVAAQRYVRDHYADVSLLVPATGNTATIPDNRLQGYLSANMFAGTEIVNSPYNGDYVINVRNVGLGASGQSRIEMIVATTGGKAIPDAVLPKIAADIGANGGFRVSATGIYDTNTVQGAYGSWQVPVADIATAPAPGSVVGFSYFGDGAVLSDFLYRNPVPGQPQAQQMNANIDSNNFGIANVAQIGGNVDTANPANPPPAPPANTVRFGGVTAATNGFARADVSIQANNVNVANMDAQGDVRVFDANNDERGRMSGATQTLTLGAAPGGATTVVADGTGQTVTVRDGTRDRAQITGTGQVRGFDAAGAETLRADAVTQNIRVGQPTGQRAEMAGTGQVRGFDAAGAETLRADAVTQNIRVGQPTGQRAEMAGTGLVSSFDNNGMLRAAINGGGQLYARDAAGVDRAKMTSDGMVSAFDNNGNLRAQVNGNNGGLRLTRVIGAAPQDIITADADAGQFVMWDGAGKQQIVADSGAGTFTMRDGIRDRAQMTRNGIFSAWDVSGTLRAQLDGNDASLTLAGPAGGTSSAIRHNENDDGLAISTTSPGGVTLSDQTGKIGRFSGAALDLAGENASGEGAQINFSNDNTLKHESANTWSMNVKNDQFRIFSGSAGTGNDEQILTLRRTRPSFNAPHAEVKGGLFSSSWNSNGGYADINPWDGAIEIGSGNDKYAYIDFKGNDKLSQDFAGRIAWNGDFSRFEVLGSGPFGEDGDILSTGYVRAQKGLYAPDIQDQKGCYGVGNKLVCDGNRPTTKMCIECLNRDKLGEAGIHTRCTGQGSWSPWTWTPNSSRYETYCRIYFE